MGVSVQGAGVVGFRRLDFTIAHDVFRVSCLDVGIEVRGVDGKL